MKNKIFYLLTIAFMLFSSTTYAQKEISVTVISNTMSRGDQPGFRVNIPEAKLKDVTAAYKKQLQLNTKVNAKETGGELISYGVVNKTISQNPFIVYSKIVEASDGIEMTVFVSEDSLTFIGENSNPDKVTAINKVLRDFAVNEYKNAVNIKLKAENEKLNQMKKDLEKLIDNENSNNKSIGSKQREIESLKTKIETNKSAQKSKADQIGRQQNMVDAISDKKSPEHELASKNLKSYQNDLKSQEKEADKMGRNIDDNNAEIKELEYKNEELKKQQADAKEKIEEQETVVKRIEKVLEGIK